MSFMTDLARKWGEEIRKTRIEQRLSVEALADLAGVDSGHLSKAERGLAGFGDESRIRLAQALGKRVEDLFSYDLETACPSAATATGAASSPTPATTAATRSPARAATARGDSAPEGSHGNE